MKWLFVTTDYPWPLTHGTWLRLYHLSRTLCGEQDQHVTILTYKGCDEALQHYRQAGVDVVTGPWGPAARRGRSRTWLGPYVYDAELAGHLAEISGGYDVTVLVRPTALQYAPEAAASGCVVADLIDDPVLEMKRKLWRDVRPAPMTRQIKFQAGQRLYERRFAPWLDLATFVSRQDARSFASRLRNTAVAFVPNGVDAVSFAPAKNADDNGRAPSVTFLGNMEHPPNEDAALFLVNDIAPLIWKRRSETKFHIIGCNPSPRIRQLAGQNVEVSGYVQDVRPKLWDSTVVMVPMRIGTGVKNKLLEAWAAQTAVVATPLACQGVPARNGRNLLLGRSAADLADCAIRLIEDKSTRRRIARAGRATVEARLTWSASARRLRKHVTRALARSNGKMVPP